MRKNNHTSTIEKIAKRIRGIKRAKECELIIMNCGREGDSRADYSFAEGPLWIYYHNDTNQIKIRVVYNKRIVFEAKNNLGKYIIPPYEEGKETWEKGIKSIIKKKEKEGTFILKPQKNLFDGILEYLI